MRSKIFFAAVILLFHASIYAQGFKIKGKVIDEADLEPLMGVSILVEELKTGTSTDENGVFAFNNISPGTYTIRATYIGHRTSVKKIVISSDQEIIIKMQEGSVDINEVVVTGNPIGNDPKESAQSAMIVSSLDLQIKRSSNVGETLNFQPGISMRSNGSAAARPVIRGFSNSRILILENGLRMGDLSGSSDDHGVSSDGSAPEKIEILRGPASLLYGSSAIGGVINIITEAIPNYIPNGLNGDADLTRGAVNNALSSSADLHFGTGKMAMHGNFFSRRSGDYKDGNENLVSNSDQSSNGYQFGISFIPNWGRAGLSYSYFSDNYGLPLNPHETAPVPVEIDMHKREVRFVAESSDLGSFIKSFSLKGALQNYDHKEISRTNGETGTAFALNSFSSDLSFSHELKDSVLHGVFGLWGMNQNYRITGDEAFTPNADYSSFAAYIFEGIKIKNVNIQFGGRFELNRINIPSSQISGVYFSADEKNYNTLSGSVGIVYNLSDYISFYSNAANAFRAPTIEELSSYAVHEATGSFDIGDRNLASEKNLGIDFGFRLREPDNQIELSGYYNSIENYIYRKPINLFYDAEASGSKFNNSNGIPVHVYSQTGAVIYGFESKAVYDFNRSFSTTLIFDYTRGKQKSSDGNLPQMPPFRFSLEPRYSTDYFWTGLILKLTAAQNLTGPNETTTKGYGLIDFYAGIKFLTGSIIHMINLKVDNLLNQPYREHLSALKEFAYMPGRNIELSYKFLF